MKASEINKDELATALRSMAAAVEAGDSFEGSIQYSVSGPRKFEVLAWWRVGNSEGQGGCEMIGESDDEP